VTIAPSTPRRCRSCGAGYDYPLPRGIATRSHCAVCAALPVEWRRALERMQRRLARLEADVRMLKDR